MKSVVLVLGTERFLARSAVEKVLRRRADFEVSRYDGAAAQPGEVLDDARTPSLLGRPRAIVVDDAGEMLRTALAAFAAYAGRDRPGALLVLVAAGLDQRLRGAKELLAASEVIACQPLKEREVAKWVVGHAREAHDLQVEAEAAEALRRRVGEDLGLLDAALSRLREQIAPRTRLRAEDVDASTEEHRSAAYFEPGNALEAGDLGAALAAVGAAFDEGLRIKESLETDEKAVATILLDALHRSYVKLLRFHLHRRGGLGEEEAARRAGCSPQQVNYFVPRVRRHRLEDLVARHRRFLEADARLKDEGSGDPRRVLERLVIELLAPSA